MAKRGHFPTTPYEGYYHRDVPKEDEELTHVGPGTPCGEYLRRFWQPVALSEELKDLPKKIRVMNEDLVVFRDFSGKTGLLALHCSHRGTSLEFGLVSERGIRCCYHGWLYDVDGRILEIPGQVVKSNYKDRLYHPAYPTLEYKGLVFAYMGPPDNKPPFPIYDIFELPGYECVPRKPVLQECNWLQNKENQMDPIHVSFLHMIVSGAQLAKGHEEIPELDWTVTPIGVAYMATRRMGENVWVRMADSILPNIAQFGSTSEDGTQVKIFNRPEGISWALPIDDTNMILYGFKLYRIVDGKRFDPMDPKNAIIQLGGDRPYEERQRQPSDYEAQTSQRPIAVHALEHLVGSDRGVIMFRKLIRESIRDVKNGRDPKGIFRKLKPGKVIPTYCQDTVLRVPKATTVEADKRLIREIGWKVAKGEIKSDSDLAGSSIPESVGT